MSILEHILKKYEFLKTFSKNYERKIGISRVLEETWGGDEKIPPTH
jgi:hypothetical protein